MKNKVKLFLVTIVCLFILVITLGYKINKYKAIETLKEGDNAAQYITAAHIYIRINNYKINDHNKNIIKENCEKIIELYKAKKVNYNDCIRFLDVIEKIEGLNSFAVGYKNKIEQLKMSEEAFNAGLESIERKDYKRAINQFSAVIEDDWENYDKAQKLKQESIKEAQQYIKYEIYDCRVRYSNSELKSLYKDQIQMKIKNNFNKIIESFDICFIAYDKNYNPIVIHTESNYNKNFFIICSAQNVNIMPNSSWGDDSMGWNIDNSENISYVTGEIKNIKFSDGELWNNPLYDVWLQKSLEKVW